MIPDPGSTFGSWTVLGPFESKHHLRRVLCQCTCGVQSPVYVRNLLKGTSTNCGCQQYQATAKRLTTHNRSRQPEYISWNAARWRCGHDPAYRDAGITFHPPWEDFEVFFAALGPRPSRAYELDREDPTRGYEPGNCRWITRAENQERRRQPGRAESGRYTPHALKPNTIGAVPPQNLGLARFHTDAGFDAQQPMEEGELVALLRPRTTDTCRSFARAPGPYDWTTDPEVLYPIPF